jgi:hypothetical protein
MAQTNYLPIFNHYVYSDLDLWPISLDQGHDTFLGPGQQLCEICSNLQRGSGVMARTNSDGRRTTNGQRHNIIRPVWRRAYKNQRIITKFKLDLHIPMKNLHMQFESYTCIETKVREQKLKIFSTGIILSKNHQTKTKFNLDLHNPIMYPYTKFESKECNRSRDN